MERFEHFETVLQLGLNSFVVGVFLEGGIEGGVQLLPVMVGMADSRL